MKKKVIWLMLVLVLIIGSGCNPKPKETPLPAPTDPPAVITTDSPTAAEVTATQASSEVQITETLAPTLPPVTHSLIPVEPNYLFSQRINDCSTGDRVAMQTKTLIAIDCDQWPIGRLERPADQPNGNYLPALDIIQAQMGNSPRWVFGMIRLYQIASGNLPPALVAGFEIDTDLDSRGNMLIVATNLSSTEWTTDGVQVWQDQNLDVGGGKPHSPDGQEGDGYETLLFDSGSGSDPDLAWVRVNPADGAVIEFAFKPTYLPENMRFAWWAITLLEEIQPAKMELLDSQSDQNSWLMDNTCGWIFNAQPSKTLINICPFTLPTAIPLPTATPKPNDSCQPVNCQALHPTDPPGTWEWNSTLCKCTQIN